MNNVARGGYQGIRGFTLIEVMIVVAIVALIAAFGYPAYEEYIIRSNRAIAKSKLLELASRQEQFFANNKRYSTTLADLGYNSQYVNQQSELSGLADAIYTLSVASPTVTTYTLTATPTVGTRQAAKDSCAALSIDQTGDRTISGAGDRCWD